MKYNLSLILIFICGSVFGQTSIFSDGTGESGYKISGNAVTVNTKDESLDMAFDLLKPYKPKYDPNHDLFNRWAIDLNLTATKGLSSIKTSDGFPVSANLGVYRGWKKSPLEGGRMRETYISVNILSESDELYDLTKATADVTYGKTYPGWKAAIGRFGYTAKNVLYGVELNFGQSTNVGDLTQSTVSTLQGSSANDSTKVFNEQLAYSSATIRGGQFNVHVNGDIAFLLNSTKITDTTKGVPPIFFALHFRYLTYQLSKPQFSPAIGLYAGKVTSPRSVNIGFNLQFVDIGNALDSKSSSPWKRATIGFTAGYVLK